ncbi:ribosome small subunit-dependent GTPase A [Listeria marthii]|uniref:Small ribosomal subunit biogenesis GTPase RsgA n=1 Tax=Listeria marthii TaxID=529731 RepID=A0A842CGL7_9LIST|nr:ribosome small subunit-dependent GTPase A [Listeria marthii]MBC1978126.1 ribosome small subunit-dependent GTPase A [Listeria marthii]MBC1997130.1 ribosome small subunit-dependent GTPase A [Listeria marthii]MBC2001457.1 ribosome small subunit-dependent GTPase A [Listeria marthii]MBC2038277.1 ribosome small subunit-dependent GTPase A [Listeria marthii]MBC2085721.1 ribosome small subunit-dependent GTPase A [Listeria marthii]
MILENYGFTSFFNEQEIATTSSYGRVTAVFRDYYRVVTENGEFLTSLKRGNFYELSTTALPAVGDFVEVSSDAQILSVLERKTVFSRMNKDSEEQLIAANFDYALIVMSLNHDFNLNRLERYLTVAWDSGATPIIILTKADLAEDLTSYAQQLETVAYGVPAYYVDNLSHNGFEALERDLKPNSTLVLLGSSGVGKSSFINSLAGADLMKTAGIREDDSKGKHTTTHREMHLLDNGWIVIDTPGMREFGIGLNQAGLETTFSDVEELAEGCRFHDCSHTQEPGCAVQAALDDGSLSMQHYENWLKLQREMAYHARKNSPALAKQELDRRKVIQKSMRKHIKTRPKK